MLRSGLKYQSLDNYNEDEVEENPRQNSNLTPTPNLLWHCLRTVALISIYFAPSIGLTFYQRWLFQSFHFPLTVVLVHLIVKYFLAACIRIVLDCCGKPRPIIEWKDHIISIAPTGIFSGIDIGFSNWGLELITVSLYTVTKSTAIIFILLFGILFKLEKKSWSLFFIVVMISTGFILFTYKATHFNMIGLILVILASMSSGVRWACVQLLLQKSNIEMKNPTDMIFHMQPWMILSVFPFAVWIEGMSLISNCITFRVTNATLLTELIGKVLFGAFIAFFMEMSEVLVVMYTSSLTLSVSGIFKEILVLVLAVKWNGDVLSPINILGLIVCLSGIVGHVVHKIKTTRYHTTSSNRIYKFDQEKYELKECLVNNSERFSLSSESDFDESNDVLFDVLNRRER